MDPTKMKVAELKKELMKRNLECIGLKAKLIERLVQAQKSDSFKAHAARDSELEGKFKEVISVDDDSASVSDVASSKQTSISEEKYEDGSEEGETVEEIPITVPTISKSTKTEPMVIDSPLDPKEVLIPFKPPATDIKHSKDLHLKAVSLIKQEPVMASSEIKDTFNKEQQVKQELVTPMEINNIAEPSEEVETKIEDDRGRKRPRSNSPRRRRSPPPNNTDFVSIEDEPIVDKDTVVLSWYDSDLNLNILKEEKFLKAKPLSEGALTLAWAGARASHGVRKGLVFYEVQITNKNIFKRFFENENYFEFRCGWSVNDSDMQLGEDSLSFAYGSIGKKVTKGEFSNYGSTFGLNDVIGVYLDMGSEKCKIEFTLNGKNQGTAFEFEKADMDGKTIFPHILTKNMGYIVNFGKMEKSLCKTEQNKRLEKINAFAKRTDERKVENLNKLKTKLEGVAKQKEERIITCLENDIIENATKTDKKFVEENENIGESGQTVFLPVIEDDILQVLPTHTFIANISTDQLFLGPTGPQNRSDCEVILIIGLPGAGKTYWANKYALEHPEKRYHIIGFPSLLNKMKVSEKSRKDIYTGKWERLLEMCTRSLIQLQDIAATRRRNFIIDQTNVYANAQRRKMRNFGGFKRTAVVIVPDEEEYKSRNNKRIEAEGRDISATTYNEMKAYFALPNLEYGWFTEPTIYPYLDEEKAKELVKKYNEALNNLPPKRKRSDRSNKKYRNKQRPDRRNVRWLGPSGRSMPPNWRGPPAKPTQDFGRFDSRDNRGFLRPDNNWMAGPPRCFEGRGYGPQGPPKPGPRDYRGLNFQGQSWSGTGYGGGNWNQQSNNGSSKYGGFGGPSNNYSNQSWWQ